MNAQPTTTATTRHAPHNYRTASLKVHLAALGLDAAVDVAGDDQPEWEMAVATAHALAVMLDTCTGQPATMPTCLVTALVALAAQALQGCTLPGADDSRCLSAVNATSATWAAPATSRSSRSRCPRATRWPPRTR